MRLASAAAAACAHIREHSLSLTGSPRRDRGSARGGSTQPGAGVVFLSLHRSKPFIIGSGRGGATPAKLVRETATAAATTPNTAAAMEAAAAFAVFSITLSCVRLSFPQRPLTTATGAAAELVEFRGAKTCFVRSSRVELERFRLQKNRNYDYLAIFDTFEVTDYFGKM